VEPCAQALAHVLEQGSSWRPYDEVPAVLARLRAAGYTVGILSDWGTSLPAILEALGLRPLADFLVVSAIDGLAKPRPAFFQRALQRAGLLPHQALMVGDSLYADIQGAAAAGIAGVLLDRRGRHPDAGVPAIRTLDEIWPHLDGAGGTASA
jgi:putative hydrolase of the HAD superfamily